MHTAPKLEARLRHPRALQDAMAARRMTVRELSVACGRDSYKSTIGNLRSGFRTTCGPHLAGRIEVALALYPGALFDLSVPSSTSATATAQTARRAA